jgi:hypothetical protein
MKMKTAIVVLALLVVGGTIYNWPRQEPRPFTRQVHPNLENAYHVVSGAGVHTSLSTAIEDMWLDA